jgi:hypothetical protein
MSIESYGRLGDLVGVSIREEQELLIEKNIFQMSFVKDCLCVIVFRSCPFIMNAKPALPPFTRFCACYCCSAICMLYCSIVQEQ